MKLKFCLFIFAIAFTGLDSYAQIARGVRYDAVSTARGVESKESALCPSCAEIPSSVKEFDNGNTFVTYKEEKIGGLSFVVRIPEQMTSDIFMEVLLRIRTLRSNGANHIAVEVTGSGRRSKMAVRDSSGEKVGLPIELLMSVAGANAIADEKTERDISLLADRNKINLKKTANQAQGEVVIAKGNHPELASSISQELGVPLDDLERVEGKQVLLLAAPVKPVNQSLLETMAQILQIQKQNGATHLVSPYLPYARSDKVDQSGITTGASLLADLLEAVGIRSITYARAHAPASSGFYTVPPFEVSSYVTLTTGTSGQGIVLYIAPDAGADKDVGKAADVAKTEKATIGKQRDKDGEKIRMTGITLPEGMTSLKGRRVLVIDDETASGSTLAEAAELAKKAGAEWVGVAVTHLAGPALKALNSEFIDAIYVTDSIPVGIEHPKLHVLSLAKEVAQKIEVGSLSQALERQRSGSGRGCPAAVGAAAQ